MLMEDGNANVDASLMKEAAAESKKRGEKSISVQAVKAVTEVRHVMACSSDSAEGIHQLIL